MKGFVKQVILFVLILALSLELAGWLVTSPMLSERFHFKGGWFKVLSRVHRSKTKLPSDTLYIGDSVGNQFFPFERTYNSLTSNAAVTMAGNYILIKNCLKHNPQIKAIVFLSVPNDLGFAFEKKLVYNNFVQPFFSLENLSDFDGLMYRKLLKQPQSLLSVFHAYKILPFSDVDFSGGTGFVDPSDYISEMQQDSLSDFALHYFQKIMKLCSQNNVDLKLISPPVPLSWKQKSQDWKKIKLQFRQSGLIQSFPDYFNTIRYFPDSCFIDGLHLRKAVLDTVSLGSI